MKRKLLLIGFFVSLLTTNFTIKAQIINQPANWPNASWTITGTYTASGFASDPRVTPNFSWDDDLAGSASGFDDISAESPQINLAAAVSGGEAQLQVSFDYVYRRVGDNIYLEWWDGSTWQIWDQLANNSNNVDYKGCTGFQPFVSQPLTISTLTATQLLEFKYRIHYNDGGFDWGFCMGSPTIISIPTPTCMEVSAITINAADITENTAVVDWIDNNGLPPANGWEIEYGPAGFTQGTGTIVTVVAHPYTLSGLTSSTNYDVYVRAMCSATDQSGWIGPVSFTTLLGVIGCGDQYVDSGGVGGNYSNNEDITQTFCPDVAGEVVTVQFLSFETENCCDYLRIYNGDSTASPLLGEFQGTNMPPLFTSTDATGCLTFVFVSDFSNTRGGWTADITCDLPPTCLAPDTLAVTNITMDSADFTWNDINATAPANGWEIVVVPAGQSPNSGTPVAVGSSPYLATGLNPSTLYDFYVRAVCDDAGTVDPSFWTGPLNFATDIAPPVCGGVFTDDGGTANNYSNGQDTTTVICPENAGDIVSVEFTMFDTEAGWDDMTIYDGNTATGTPLGVYDGTTLPPTFISTHPSGCLTFVFSSDGIINRAGWEANVICMAEPTCWFVTNVNTGATTTTSISISWTDALNTPAPAGGWDIEYGTVGFIPGTGAGTVVNVASSPFVVTGLSPSTNYDFYVSARCAADGSDSATWVGPILGRTDDAPPPNDTCFTAIPINTNLTCIPVMGNNILATSSSTLEGEVTPNCADPFINNPANVLDVWFSFIVPNTNAFIIETSNAGGMVDSIISAYSGSCGNLVELDCQDDSVIDPNSDDFRFSSITLRNLTVGETIYIRVWSAPAYTSAGNVHPNVQGAFNICVMDTGAGRSASSLGFGDVQIEYHPNPVKDNLVIKANATISNISVYNILGKKVINNSYNTKNINLDTSILSSGTYFVRSLVSGKVKMFKIIKE